MSRQGGVRAAVAGAAAVALLAGPTVLAFARGGFFPVERLWAAIGAWVLAAVAAVVAPRPLPRALPGRIAVGALAGLLGWVLLSRSWAPLAGAGDRRRAAARALPAALIAAAALLRGRGPRAVEPALGAGRRDRDRLRAVRARCCPGVIDLAS